MPNESTRLDALEAQIEAEDAEDAATADDVPPPPIGTYDGWAGTPARPRGVPDDEG